MASIKSREKSLSEIRGEFIENLRGIARYWAQLENVTPRTGESETEARCRGVVFSVLALLDGVSAGSPGFALVPTVHEDDKAYCIAEGEDYYPYYEQPEGDIRENVMLHEELYGR